MQKKIIRLLIVDDSPDDSEIAVAALRKAGHMLKSQSVHDLAGFQSAIEKGGWDLVVSEHTLPHFGAGLALEALKRAHLDIPLIVLTSAIRDTDLVKIMQAGARDVIVKNRITRLVPAIERELAVAEERAEYRKASTDLKEMEDKHRAVIESAREAICYTQDGMHINANKAYLTMFEYEDIAELEGVPLMDLIDKSDRPRFKEHSRKTGAAASEAQEFLAVRKSGARFHIETAMSPLTINGENCMQVVVSDVSKRRAVENKLRYLNEHDALSGLYNRHYFTQELTRAIERVKRDHVEAALIYIELQDLRRVSKNYGHTVADRFLLASTRLLRETFGESAVLARFGDHEFTVLLTDARIKDRKALATRIEQALAATSFEENGIAVKCSLRVAHTGIDATTESMQKLMAGIYDEVEPAPTPATSKSATPTPPVPARPTPPPKTRAPTAAPTAPSAPSVMMSPEEMAPNAIADLPGLSTTPPAAPDTPTISATPSTPTYNTTPMRPRIGAAPSGNVRPSAPSTEPAPKRAAAPVPKPVSAAEIAAWVARIKTAVEQEAFELNYLPIINLHGDPAEYFEVLVRMIGDNDQRIAAGLFMPHAEQAKQSVAIDRWVVRRAIRALADLHQQDRKATFFINLSVTALHDVEMVVMIQRWLTEAGLKGQYVVLELEESAMAANPGPTVAFLRAAKRVGCRVCIDNFGRAVDAIAKLEALPVDYVKIDGSLVRNASDDNAALDALSGVVNASKTVSNKAIAKSVETAAALSILWTLGLDYAQGHYFQAADAKTDYQFNSEEETTTLSSEAHAPNWARS